MFKYTPSGTLALSSMVIHVPTPDLSRVVQKFLFTLGYTWGISNGGRKVMDSASLRYKEATCIHISRAANYLYYGSYMYYRSCEYNIYDPWEIAQISRRPELTAYLNAHKLYRYMAEVEEAQGMNEPYKSRGGLILRKESV